MVAFAICLDSELLRKMPPICVEYEHALLATKEMREGALIYAQYRPALVKQLSDEIDRVLAKHYGFTDEELDFIINYDIKYRMGLNDDDNNEVEE